MMNNKGFTLTEVLLAAMIVGIIGIALAALTTAALRESNIGRTRIMLRNQISLFLRQFRQDLQNSEGLPDELGYTKSGPSAPNKLTLNLKQLNDGPNVKYECTDGDKCTRDGETVLNHIEFLNNQIFTLESVGDVKVMTTEFVVGLNGEPPIKEYVKATFVSP